MKASILILDAANPVGSGVIEQALGQQRSVIAVSRDPVALRALAARFPTYDLTVVDGAIDNDDQAATLATALRELDRPIAGVVIAQCSEPTRNRVLDTPARDFHRLLEADLLPNLAAARHLVPLLAASGRNAGYVVIGSPGSDHPWVGYGSRSLSASASTMLVRVLHEEARTLGVRVQMLAVNRPVRTDSNRAWSCDGWPEVSAIAAQALDLIEQADPRVAATAIVPFVDARHTTSTSRNRWRASADARSRDVSALAAEPGLLAHMTSEPERIATTDSGGPRVLGQAWSLLEPLFSLKRNEAEKP